MMDQPKDLQTLTKMLNVATRKAEHMKNQALVASSKVSVEKDGHKKSSSPSDLAAIRFGDSVAAFSFDSAQGMSSEPPIIPLNGLDEELVLRDAPLPLDVLKESIRAAIQLEFATVPPYLIAMWSIIDQSHPVAKSIRAVAHEEMLHVSILCNFLSALGERPVLTGDVVPQYPGRLPGGVHRELEIELLAYGEGALRTFLEIERPKVAVEIVGEPKNEFPSEDTTIGEFYAAILKTYEQILPELDPSHQIAGPFSWFVLSKPEDVREAIELITSQGEGASGLPFNREQCNLSHYYRFKSLMLSVELVWDKKQKKLKKGDSIPQPSVFTLARTSQKGMVWQCLDSFVRQMKSF